MKHNLLEELIKFAFAKLPTQTCVCEMIPRFAPAKRGFLLPEAHEIAAGRGQIAKTAVLPIDKRF